jgi:hypothetical protein
VSEPRRTKVLKLARDLARSGRHDTRHIILAELEIVEGAAAAFTAGRARDRNARGGGTEGAIRAAARVLYGSDESRTFELPVLLSSDCGRS